VPDRAERELFLGDMQALDERAQCGISACAGAIDGSITSVFSVARIIDKQKGIAVVGIAVENRHPVESKRAVPTKGDPETFRNWFASGNVVSRLFPHGQRVGDFD